MLFISHYRDFGEVVKKDFTNTAFGGANETENNGTGRKDWKHMDTEIIKINENSWRIEDSGVRFFLLTGTDRALLVDTGRNIDNAREIAESLTTLPVMLVNTHADGDHVAGNGKFDAFYMHPDEEPNYRRGCWTLAAGRSRSSICPGTRRAASPCWTGTAASSSAGTPSRTGASSCSAASGTCRIISAVWSTCVPGTGSSMRSGLRTRPSPSSPT